MPSRSFNDAEQLELALPVVRDAEPDAGDVLRRRRTLPYSRRDPATMSVKELLVSILGPAREPICAELAVDYGSFRRLSAVHPAEFRDRGLATAAIDKLAALFEIARRFGEEEFIPGQMFRGSYDVYAHFRERFAELRFEVFYAVLLDNKNRKITDVQVSQGSLTASIVHPRDVYSRVIRESAAGVIFVHNHPSGDPTPSKEDLEITRRLREVGELVGVRVLDHVVIGHGKYVSFVDDGYW